jgi:hypothetical protein
MYGGPGRWMNGGLESWRNYWTVWRGRWRGGSGVLGRNIKKCPDISVTTYVRSSSFICGVSGGRDVAAPYHSVRKQQSLHLQPTHIRKAHPYSTSHLYSTHTPSTRSPPTPSAKPPTSSLPAAPSVHSPEHHTTCYPI